MSEQPTPTGTRDPATMALLAYLGVWLSGLIVYLIEKQNYEVRFHAAQSMLAFGALTLLNSAATTTLTLVGLGLVAWLTSAIINLATFTLWLVMMVNGYRLNHLRLPIIAGYAEALARR